MIVPLRAELYPKTWKQLSAALRRVRGNVCEVCGLPNHVWIARSEIDGSRYLIWDWQVGGYREPDGTPIRLSEVPEEYLLVDPIRIVLTVHHLGADRPNGEPGDPDDKSDNRLCNLQVLCQRDHFIADQQGNITKRRHTRLERAREATRELGQLELIE